MFVPPTIGAVTKRMFFDQPAVQRVMDRRSHKVLNRLGGYAKVTARRSIKRVGHARKMPKKYTSKGHLSKAWIRWMQEVRKRPASTPGTPPYTHSRLLPDAIVYGYDPIRRSVVIGPLASKMGDEVAGLHERGGTRFGRRYPARPYMQPAREKAVQQLPRFFREAQ